MYHFIKRTDGFQATQDAHADCVMLTEIVRDRTVPAHLPTLVYFRCVNDDLRPGDTEVTEAEYDAFHTATTVTNFERKFIADKEAFVARTRTEHAAHDASRARMKLAGLTDADVDRIAPCACAAKIAETQRLLVADRAECDRCRLDVATNGTRKRRLREERDRLAAELPVCVAKRDEMRAAKETGVASGRPLSEKQKQVLADVFLPRAEADVLGREQRLAAIAERLGT